MRHVVTLLGVIFCLSLSVPAWAGMADCDGPATAAETENREMLDFVDGMGTSPLHSGAAALLRTCEAMKRKFNAVLSALGATRSNPPTDAQIDEALNAAASAPAPKSDASQARKPMSRNVAVIERNRVADMDAKAESLVQSNCGGFGCDRILESMVDPVIREAEKLNADPEYLAQLPKYAPIGSVAAAARFGWTRQDGFWVNRGVQRKTDSANTSTLGSYLLSVDECKKLRDRLEQAIKAKPIQEPTELSFFEAECLPQLPDDRAVVAAWRSGFKAARGVAETAPDSRAAQSALAEAPLVPEEGLSQWNSGLVVEEQQYQATIEEKRKAAAIAEEEQRKAASTVGNSFPFTQKTVGSNGKQSAEMLVSQCSQEIEATATAFYNSDLESVRRRHSSSARPMEAWKKDWEEKAFQYAEIYMQNSSLTEMHENYTSALRASESRAERKDWHDPFTEADFLSACLAKARLNGLSDSASTNQRGQVNQTANASSASDDGKCEAKLNEVDKRVAAALPGCGESATCNLQAAMWGLSQQISVIESYCPSGKFAAKLPDAKNQLKSATTNCNQIVSGGSRCSPRL